MLQAQIRKDDEDFDIKMQMLAWQTALLMNSTGNYKKRIRPDDLYTTLAEVNEKETLVTKDSSKVKKALQEELLSTFTDSEGVIV